MWRLLNYTPNQWALDEVHSSLARFNTYCTCRQCGKSVTLSMLLHEYATKPRDAFGWPLVGVMTPDFTHTEMVMDKWEARLREAGIPYIPNRNDHTIRLPWHGDTLVKGLSASQNPWAAAGPTWSAFFIDEAQGVPDAVWNKLRPGLGIRRARLFAFGTPDVEEGQTWFEGLYRRGQMPDQLSYHSFTMSVLQNPWLTEEEIEEARWGNITEETFRMLYLGQWVQLANKVFRWADVDKARRVKGLIAPQTGRGYVAGLDVGQGKDYTVLYIMDAETKDVVFKWRYSRMDYTLVEDLVATACKAFSVQGVMMENNGPGRPVRDHLRNKGITVWDVDLGNRNKAEIIESLNADLQQERVGLPEDDLQLYTELKAYLRKPTPSGRMGYSAPEGFFDDCVIALAYAAEACRTHGTLVVDTWASWGRGTLADMGRRVA